MNVFRLALIVVSLAVGASGCQDSPGRGDVLRYTAPPGWGVPGADYVVGNREEIPGQYSIIEWVKRGDNIDNWNELITTEDWSLEFVSQIEGTVGQYVAKQKRDQDGPCPGRSRWNVIKERESDIVYEAWYAPCPALADHYRNQGNHTLAKIAEIQYYEISRIFDGTRNRFRLAYAAKGSGVSEHQRAKWLGWLQSAEIAPQ